LPYLGDAVCFVTATASNKQLVFTGELVGMRMAKTSARGQQKILRSGVFLGHVLTAPTTYAIPFFFSFFVVKFLGFFY
jgi:hypothetical protein